MKNKIKTISLLLCIVLVVSFSLIGCDKSENNNKEASSSANTSRSTSTSEIIVEENVDDNNTSNYSQEFEIDENDKNSTSAQAYDSVDLG